MVSRKAFVELVEAILEVGAKHATKYLSPKDVVKATRRGKNRKHDRTTQILFTIGRPNYAERKFIKLAQKAGEPFPIKRVLLKFDKQKKAA